MIFIFICINIFLSNILLYFFYPIFKRNFVDNPNKRSSHIKPIPRGGGLIFAFLSLLSLSIFEVYKPLFLVPLIIVSLIDDRFNISSKFRYLIQFLSSFLLVYNSPTYFLIKDIYGFKLIILILLMTILGTAIINFCNFMDGLDGLLAGVMIIIFLSLAFAVDIKYLLICGPLIGFLKWNWSPAKIFMGDVGSTFLGGMLFYSLLSSQTFNNTVLILLISSLILIDPFICLIVRSLNKQPIFSAHNLHLYQRLSQSGWGHKKVSISYTVFSSLLFLGYLIGGLKTTVITFSLLLIVGFWLHIKIAKPYKF